LVVGRKASGELALDISEDLSLRTAPQNALALSKGIAVILPRSLVGTYADLVIDFEHGGFVFRGSATPRTFATRPAGVELSRERLFRISPSLRDDEDAVERTAHYLREGASHAAVVMSLDPLVVAAYAEDLRAVALLGFPKWLAGNQDLKLGDRLLTSNSYVRGSDIAGDLLRGQGAELIYCNFSPLIADFLGENPDEIEARKAEIEETEWATAAELGYQAVMRARGRYRDGCPPNSGTPASSLASTTEQLATVTPRAAAVLRRLAGAQALLAQLRCVPDGSGFRYKFDLVPPGTSCVMHCESNGIRVQIPDRYTLKLVRGITIDYKDNGFLFNNPNTRKKPS
jgi:Fe-S cluster assembly iron-binding protein IscA